MSDPRGAATLSCEGRAYRWHRVDDEGPQVRALPRVLRIVLEALLRQRATEAAFDLDVRRVLGWLDGDRGAQVRIRPCRVLMDDTAGLPLIGELAALRDAACIRGKAPSAVDLAVPLDFVVDHSIIGDHTGSADALERNMALELTRNAERYRLLKWATQAFSGLRVFPPGTGICHQVNLEFLARVVRDQRIGAEHWAWADTVVGIDSHTPMVNALGIAGWGVSGIEGLAAALGEAVGFDLPPVVGCRLHGALRPGVTATDLVLTLTRELREHGVVGAVVEYFGPGVAGLSVADRATVANMTPEAGATMSWFPIDDETLRYLRRTGRRAGHVALVEAHARAQGLWAADDGDEQGDRAYDAVLAFDLAAVRPSMSGPRQPHGAVPLGAAGIPFRDARASAAGDPAPDAIRDGDVVIAAIASCTNTANPALMIGAGLLARNAVRRGLTTRPWVRTSLSPGSRAVADYLRRSGLQDDLDRLGFHVAGFGCMSCVGFSGPLPPRIVAALDDGVRGVAVISGNRNYEGRVHEAVRHTYLASPALVVAHALAGTVRIDLETEPLGLDAAGRAVRLAEIWPDPEELARLVDTLVGPEVFGAAYRDPTAGTQPWRALPHPCGPRYDWPGGSTLIVRPDTFDAISGPAAPLEDLEGARILAMYADMVTTEHLSPMGPIPEDSAAGAFLKRQGIAPSAFVSYAARRLNAEVMLRGTLASRHLRNELLPAGPAGWTVHAHGGVAMPIHEAAQRYRAEGTPLVLVAGKSFGAGSSRDWSARGPARLGVRAVIAESYERIYRSNLVAAGVLPLQFPEGEDRRSLGLDAAVTLDLPGSGAGLAPGVRIPARISRPGTVARVVTLRACLHDDDEVDRIRHGGLLPRLMRHQLAGRPEG